MSMHLDIFTDETPVVRGRLLKRTVKYLRDVDHAEGNNRAITTHGLGLEDVVKSISACLTDVLLRSPSDPIMYLDQVSAGKLMTCVQKYIRDSEGLELGYDEIINEIDQIAQHLGWKGISFRGDMAILEAAVFVATPNIEEGAQDHSSSLKVGLHSAVKENIITVDCEFNGYQGDLITIALVGPDGGFVYLAVDEIPPEYTEWVAANVIPVLVSAQGFKPEGGSREGIAGMIATFLSRYSNCTIVADWPVDIQHLCDLIITGPGKMADISGLRMEVIRVDSYPVPEDAQHQYKQHNALDDARALQLRLQHPEHYEPKE